MLRAIKKIFWYLSTLFYSAVLFTLGFRFSIKAKSAKDLEKVRFGFVGEFGYLILTYAPFLNYISRIDNVRLKTISGGGLAPYLYFSHDHKEVGGRIETEAWGSLSGALRLWRSKKPGEKIFVPTNIWQRSINLGFAGLCWDTSNIHRDFSGSDAYRPLRPSASTSPGTVLSELKSNPYAVINLKYYFSWPGSTVRNSYSLSDLLAIKRWGDALGLALVINRAPVGPGEGEESFSDEELDRFIATNNFIDLAPVYETAGSLNEAGARQVAALRGAEHVFATQGGNGFLTAITSQSFTVIMKKGEDWIDFQSLKSYYGFEFECVYEAEQSSVIRNLRKSLTSS